MYCAPSRSDFTCPWFFCLGFTWLLLGLLACSLSAAKPAKRSFDIPAGLAETTLRQFADQAGGQFIFSATKVAGVRTNPIRGDFTPRDALDRLVAGTDLRVIHDERTGALTVDRVMSSTA